MNVALTDNSIREFSILIEEASRSTDEGVKFFIEPADGVLARSQSRRHHFVFGRRGSGKSSLLKKVEHELTLTRTPAASVDLEPFKGHSYPDLLISVLIASLTSFKKWLETYATAPGSKTTLWSKMFGSKPTTKPLDRKAVLTLIEKLTKELKDLEKQLYRANESDIQINRESSETISRDTSTKLSLPLGGITPSIGQSNNEGSASSDKTVEQFKRNKVEFLHRRVIVYQKLFDELKTVTNETLFCFSTIFTIFVDLSKRQLSTTCTRLGKGMDCGLKLAPFAIVLPGIATVILQAE